jgi:regulatory protein
MATITGILRQKNDRFRASIFVDGEFLLGVNEETIEEFRLRKGDEWSEALRARLKPFDDWISAKRDAMQFAGRRARTEKQVRDRLKKEAIDDPIIDRVIDHLASYQMLDDARWADSFLNERLRKTAISRQQLMRELIQKGIAKPIAQLAIEKLDTDRSDRALAQKAAEKKLRQLNGRNVPEAEGRRKLFQFLRTRGFQGPVIKETLEALTKHEVIFDDA